MGRVLDIKKSLAELQRKWFEELNQSPRKERKITLPRNFQHSKTKKGKC